MQAGDPQQLSILIAITMAGTDMSGVNPTFNRTGVTLNGTLGHALIGNDRFLFTHPLAYTAIGAPVIVDDGFLFCKVNGVNRAISNTKPAADAFVGIYFHRVSS
jgi:hypothetical protein